MRKSVIIFGVLWAMLAVGCKPTEKNYKAAYDAALQKRQAAATDPDIDIPDGALLQTDGPQKRVVDGDTVYVQGERLKFFTGEEHAKHRYSVAVAAYKMKTNCSAQVSDLFAKGYAAFGVENPEGKFYVIAGSFDTLGEAVAFSRKFAAAEKKHVYSGLPEAPVILID